MRSKSWGWWLAYSTLLAVLTSIPYAVGYATQDQDWHFSGFFFALEDANSYVAKMRLGSAGEWLFRSPYTSMPQKGVLAFTSYILLGKLAGQAPSYDRLVLAFHSLRILSIPLVVLATDWFLGVFIPSGPWRKIATIVATAGGGLGWLVLITGRSVAGSLPLEFISPEAFGFLGLLGIPHLELARAALLTGLGCYLRSQDRAALGWASGAALATLGLLQPIGLAAALAVLIAHWIVLLGAAGIGTEFHNWLRAGAKAIAVPAPLVVYLGISFLRDPFLQAWGQQNLLASPQPIHYLLAYALVLAPAGIGAYRIVTRRHGAGLLLVAWMVIFPWMVYAPVSVQRRLAEGCWVALLALAGFAVTELRPVRIWKWLRAAALAPLSLSSLTLIAGGAAAAGNPGEPVFLPAAEVRAYRTLAHLSRRGQVALASFAAGNEIPTWAPLRVVIGHGPETAGLSELEPAVWSFFDPAEPDGERLSFLREHQVEFLFFGPHERELGAWDPGQADWLNLEFSNGGYAIYRVLR